MKKCPEPYLETRISVFIVSSCYFTRISTLREKKNNNLLVHIPPMQSDLLIHSVKTNYKMTTKSIAPH